MKTKNDLKMELTRLVARKVELTRARIALKRVPFKTRTAEQHAEMLYLWSEGATQKELIRSAALAYAFVRGRRYWLVERQVGPGNAPWAFAIARDAEVDEAAVKAWLDEKPTAEERATFDAHLAAAKARAREVKSARAAARTAA